MDVTQLKRLNIVTESECVYVYNLMLTGNMYILTLNARRTSYIHTYIVTSLHFTLILILGSYTSHIHNTLILQVALELSQV